jgi:hypothetical protein
LISLFSKYCLKDRHFFSAKFPKKELLLKNECTSFFESVFLTVRRYDYFFLNGATLAKRNARLAKATKVKSI